MRIRQNQDILRLILAIAELCKDKQQILDELKKLLADN